MPSQNLLKMCFFSDVLQCRGFMPLKEYVDSRFSTPDEMSRFKSVQWIIGYVLGMELLARLNLSVTTHNVQNAAMMDPFWKLTHVPGSAL